MLRDRARKFFGQGDKDFDNQSGDRSWDNVEEIHYNAENLEAVMILKGEKQEIVKGVNRISIPEGVPKGGVWLENFRTGSRLTLQSPTTKDIVWLVDFDEARGTLTVD